MNRKRVASTTERTVAAAVGVAKRMLGAALLALFTSCTGPGDTAVDPTDDTERPDTDEPVVDEPPARVVVYQLVVRHFSNTDPAQVVDGTLADNGVGRFADIDAKAIAGIRELGVTHVWLTGVVRQATLTDWSEIGLPPDDPDVVKGRAGSFYAIRDYFDTCPDYAEDPARRREELRALVDRLHEGGLKVLVDLVPNHVARGYHSVVRPERDFGVDDDRGVFFAADNSFFYLADPPGQALALSRPAEWNPSGVAFDGAFAPEDGTEVARTPRATGNNVTSPAPAATDWYETVKLNWGQDFTTGDARFEPRPATWDRMDEIVAYWQDDMDVDGFRADFAHFVPAQAWTWLIAQARSRDPDTLFVAEAYAELDGLLDAGFDAVYHDAAYDVLKRLYQGRGTQADVDSVVLSLGDEDRHRWLHYLENHDERRIASPIVVADSPDDSGFGSAAAGRQLAPLQFLLSPGPVLVYNGQEVGESGAGREGFGGDDGRSSLFDYMALPALQGWVNGHAYDGGGLSTEARALRDWYAALLTGPAADPAVRGSGFWGLEYANNSAVNEGFPDDLYSFARFRPGAGRLVVVVVNFRPGAPSSGALRLPQELTTAAGLADEDLVVNRIFDERGVVDEAVAGATRFELSNAGFPVVVSDQAAAVFEVRSR